MMNPAVFHVTEPSAQVLEAAALQLRPTTATTVVAAGGEDTLSVRIALVREPSPVLEGMLNFSRLILVSEWSDVADVPTSRRGSVPKFVFALEPAEMKEEPVAGRFVVRWKFNTGADKMIVLRGEGGYGWWGAV